MVGRCDCSTSAGGRIDSPNPLDLLEKLALGDLRTLAASASIDLKGCRKREDILRKVRGAPEILRLLAMPEWRLRAMLSGLSLRDIRAVAMRHDIDTSDGRNRGEIIHLILESSNLKDVIDDLERSGKEKSEVGEHRAAAEDHLIRGTRTELDFGRAEDLLDQVRMRFEEHSYDRAMALVREASTSMEGLINGFEKVVWGYTVLCCRKLMEGCGKAGDDMEEALKLLGEMERAYVDGSFRQKLSQLRRLEEISLGLYSKEVQKARGEIYRVQEIVFQVNSLGADSSKADEVLTEASDALRRGDHLLCVELCRKAESLAEHARQECIEEIERSIPMTMTLINEAENVGADVAEAERLLEKAQLAFDQKEYVLTSELVKRAERHAMQSQHYQIEKAMELRKRQVEKARDLIASIEPIIVEAEAYGIESSEARTLLLQAKDVLAKGDYVNGTVFARNAAEAAKRLEVPLQGERRKRGLTRPPQTICSACGATSLSYNEDGTGKCSRCGRAFQWRSPTRIWHRVVKFFKE